MQADVRGDAAAAFSGPLYRALAQCRPVDVALAQARQAVVDVVGSDRRDWGLAHLLVRGRPEDILPMEFEVPDATLLEIRRIPEFGQSAAFVDRTAQRRSLCFGVDPIDGDPASPGTAYKDVLVLHGDSDVGKSWLLLYCLERCKLRGWNLAYVDMKRGGAKNFLDTLRLIRDGDPHHGSLLRRGTLDRAAFNRFNHELNRLDDLLAKRTPPPPQPGPGAVIPDQRLGQAWPAEGYALGLHAHLTGLFRSALQQAAGGRPLVVALDHPDILEWDFREALVPHLIAAVAQRQLCPVRMILAFDGGRDNHLFAGKYDLSKLAGSYEAIEVPLLPRDDFVRYTREYCRHYRHPLDADMLDLIDVMARKVPASWKPSLLRDRIEPWGT